MLEVFHLPLTKLSCLFKWAYFLASSCLEHIFFPGGVICHLAFTFLVDLEQEIQQVLESF